MIASLAANTIVTLPLDRLGSGDPLGPAVIVMASGTEFTRAGTDAVAEVPWPSVTTTVRVQVCWAPVALTGAVHVGFWVVALGVKLPAASEPVHVSLHV